MAAIIDAARARTMKKHQYRTDNETLMSMCDCGVEVSTLDIGVHIEQDARAAAEQAVKDAERSQ